MQGNKYHCSGYRLVHWNPSLRGPTHMLPGSRATALQIAATISYYVARNVRIDSESSKLLILSRHSDTISDLEDVLGASASDLPPTLYDFYLVALYRLHYLSSRLNEFPKRNHNNQWVDPKPDSITNLAIHAHIKDDTALIQELEDRATLPAIIELVENFPRFFTSYCTLSNTVKAIGIGGTASLFLSIKMSGFLANSREAEARNLVALTRSKGLCVVLLPFTDRFPSSALHSLRTMCGYRQGIFTVGAARLDHQALGDFISQPDTVSSLDDLPYTFDDTTLKGRSPMALPPTSFTSPPATRSPQAMSGKWRPKTSNGTAPCLDILVSFLALHLTPSHSALHVNIAHFPYPPPNSKSRVDSSEPPGWTLFSASGSFYFAAASMSQGHVHPEKALVVDPDDYPLPPHIIRWPDKSPGRASNLPLATEAERFPVPQWLSPKARALYEQGPVFLTTPKCLLDDTLDPKDWLPAFCAHSIPGFAREHILSLQTPEVLRDFGLRVASPFLEKDHMKALEYLKSLIASTEDDWQVKRRRQRPPPLPVGPPDENNILLLFHPKLSY